MSSFWNVEEALLGEMRGPDPNFMPGLQPPQPVQVQPFSYGISPEVARDIAAKYRKARIQMEREQQRFIQAQIRELERIRNQAMQAVQPDVRGFEARVEPAPVREEPAEAREVGVQVVAPESVEIETGPINAAFERGLRVVKGDQDDR